MIEITKSQLFNGKYPLKFRHSSWYAIIILLIFVAVSLFSRSYFHIPSGDELDYQYVWEIDDPIYCGQKGHRYDRQVNSINDIIQTQIIHYHRVNGRSIVHAIEQAFTNHELEFSIINSLVFILFVWLIVFYSTSDNQVRSKYFLWILIISSLLFLFPYQHSLWISINVGLNYLWPAAMTMTFLILWEKALHKSIDRIWSLPIAIFAFIYGWSHEGYVVPVAGATFLYYCFHIRMFRGITLWLCIPFWIGAIIMVFAPGNLYRFFEGSNPSYTLKIANGIDNLFHLCMIWILFACILFLIFSKKKSYLKNFCTHNIPLCLVLAVGFVFTMFANTAPYSHIIIELSSLLFMLKFLCTLKCFKVHKFTAISIIITILFVILNVIIMRDNLRLFYAQQEVIQRYRTTNDNVFEIKDLGVSPLSKPFLKKWKGNDWLIGMMTRIYGKDKNSFELMYPADLKALKNPEEFFICDNKFPGNAPVYKAPDGEYLWILPGAITPSDTLISELYPVDWNHNAGILVRIKFLLFPDSYQSTEILKIDTVNSQFKDIALRVTPLPLRKIKAINIKR